GQPPQPFDRLVLAAGAHYSWFGHDDWAAVAPGLKTLADARAIRARLLSAFERAEAEPDPARQPALMTAAVVRRGPAGRGLVGGGPTGVELAGAVAELARWTLRHDFRRIDPRDARVVLIEAGPRLLPSFPEQLSRYARQALEKLGIEVRTGAAVTGVDADGVT